MISTDIIMERMKETLLVSAGDRIKKIVIYGSMARGEDTVESDYDCLAVVESIDSAVIEAIDDFAAEMLIKYGTVFSIIPVEESSFRKNIYNPLFININREGVVLWQKTA